ncbi:hypothetical protein OG900_20945 [Streptomyces sp. NBC_00433]
MPHQAELEILTQFEKKGYASLSIGSTGTACLVELVSAAQTYFDCKEEVKFRNSVKNRNNGYRPVGSAHAGNPDEFDLNDSFLYWNPERSRIIPGHREIATMLNRLEIYRKTVAIYAMSRVVDELRLSYDYNKKLDFESASLLQVNSFASPSNRELLQTRHEDGVVATILWTDASGLEGCNEEKLTSLQPGPDEVLIMPGGILSAMTGGGIRPFYHQVRNCGILGRKSVMYFSCFDVNRGPIAPFVVNASNRHTDIRRLILSSTDMFGLAENFVVASDE